MQKLYQQHRRHAEFLLVVTREVGHKIPGLEFLLDNPYPDRDTRCRNLKKAMQIEHVTIPAVIDNEDATVQTAYKAFPLRLVVIDRAGCLAFDGKFDPGKGGLDLPQAREWLEFNLGIGDSR